jgi:hypothetical protein
MFEKISEAKIGFEGAYFQPGRYGVEITGIKLFQNRKGMNRIAIECCVLDSSDTTSHPIGSSVCQMLSLEYDGTMRDFKSFIRAAVPEVAENEINESTATWITDNGEVIKPETWAGLPDSARQLINAGTYAQVQPCRGLQRVVVASHKPTERGGVFTKHAWSRYSAAPPVSLTPPSPVPPPGVAHALVGGLQFSPPPPPPAFAPPPAWPPR